MYDPKPFFAQKSTGTSVFDYAEMKRWVALLNDTEIATGLPKTMQKDRWSRMVVRSTREQQDGSACLHFDMRNFEWDSSEGDWSRLRTSTTTSYSYVQKGGGGGGGGDALPPE